MNIPPSFDVFCTIASVFMFGTAGFCIFLVLFNRVLILTKDRKSKTPLIILHFCVICFGFAFAGYFLDVIPWIIIPAGIFFIILCGEIRRILIRYRCRGVKPQKKISGKISIKSPVTTTKLIKAYYEIRIPGWKGPAFRITHISDLHVSGVFPDDYYTEMMKAVEETKADLGFITGDFVTKIENTKLLPGILKTFGKFGTFAVLGNHDYWEGADLISEKIIDAGITLLKNESTEIFINGNKIIISGCDDPWGPEKWKAPEKEKCDLFFILSHTADNIYRLKKSGADAVFSGHYHAGQIRIPILGPIVVPSIYGRRFDHGHFILDKTHLFITSGVGADSPPLRIYCPPDIFIIDIQPGKCS
jgi:predicted MPP superfamily phosphohydrolase